MTKASKAKATLYRVFAEGPGGGSPCPVVTGADDLDDERMLWAARGFGLETVFVQAPTTPGCDVRLRYFVPEHEMEMCVHATVAALTHLAGRKELRPGAVAVQTALGTIRTEIRPDGVVIVEQFTPAFNAPAPEQRRRIVAALGCRVEQIIGRTDTPQAVSVSRAKLLVELDGPATLHRLDPDADLVRQLCADLGVTGLYPFTDHHGRVVSARQFPADSGYREDPATGLAAAALGALIAQREPADGSYTYHVRQGETMGRPSLIAAHASRSHGSITRVAVSGTAHRADPPD
jgi:PhzF family phenazine biosynthesis protein